MSERDYVEDKNGVIRKRKTHCKHGHPFDGTEAWATNWKGYSCRICRVCDKLRMQRKREKPDFKVREAAAMKRWRETHVEEYRAQYRAAHERKKQILLDARSKGCMYCGEKHPGCLDFHHRDPSLKEGHIGVFRRFGTKRLLAEIAKCDVLCANCHRKHHDSERKRIEGE